MTFSGFYIVCGSSCALVVRVHSPVDQSEYSDWANAHLGKSAGRRSAGRGATGDQPANKDIAGLRPIEECRRRRRIRGRACRSLRVQGRRALAADAMFVCAVMVLRAGALVVFVIRLVGMTRALSLGVARDRLGEGRVSAE